MQVAETLAKEVLTPPNQEVKVVSTNQVCGCAPSHLQALELGDGVWMSASHPW